MAVTFLPQAQIRYPGNADVSQNINALGESISKSIKEGRDRNALLKVGTALKSGDAGAAQEAAFESGNPQLALSVNNLIERKAERAEDRSWRESQADRAQKNADRAFGLQQQQFEFQKEYKEKELGLERLKTEFQKQGGYKNLKERAEVESGLRKEYTGLSKSFVEVRDAFGRIQASAKDPSAAGDLALIFNYMKMLDPGSTVREGEFATAQNSAGVPDQIRSLFNRAISGERLAPNVRSDFLSRAGSLYKTQESTHNKLRDQFKSIGERLGVDVESSVPDLGPAGNPNDPLGIR